MLVSEVYKHCVIVKEKGKSGPIGSIWEKLSDTLRYRKIYMGLCNFEEYDVWRYNPHLEVWEYHSQKTDFDVLTSYLNRESSV